MGQRRLSLLDKLITEADSVMRTITNRGNQAERTSPSQGHSDAELSERERAHATAQGEQHERFQERADGTRPAHASTPNMRHRTKTSAVGTRTRIANRRGRNVTA